MKFYLCNPTGPKILSIWKMALVNKYTFWGLLSSCKYESQLPNRPYLSCTPTPPPPPPKITRRNSCPDHTAGSERTVKSQLMGPCGMAGRAERAERAERVERAGMGQCGQWHRDHEDMGPGGHGNHRTMPEPH